jgi:hypothetical protein
VLVGGLALIALVLVTVLLVSLHGSAAPAASASSASTSRLGEQAAPPTTAPVASRAAVQAAPAASAVPTTLSVPSPSPGAAVTHSGHLKDDLLSLQPYDGSYGQISYDSSDKLVVNITPTAPVAVANILPVETTDRFQYSIETSEKNVGAKYASFYGLIFRGALNARGVDANDHYYFFGINGRRGSYVLKKNSGYTWSELKSETTNPAIVAGENRLTVIAAGSHYSLLVNGTPVGDVDDNSLTGSKIGIAIDTLGSGDASSFQFGDYEVKPT